MAKKKKNSKSNSADVVNHKKVVIVIDEDLSPEQEAYEISKQLRENKLLGSNTSNQKLLDDGKKIKVKHLETQIVIKRVSKEKPAELLVCSVCQTQYEENLGFNYFTNIGGTVKKKITCSEQCADVIISLSPSRFSKKKSQIRPAFL